MYLVVGSTDAGSIKQEQLSTEDSSTSEPTAKKKKVKRVSWVDESKLCSYFYFQMDEAERGQCLPASKLSVECSHTLYYRLPLFVEYCCFVAIL